MEFAAAARADRRPLQPSEYQKALSATGLTGPVIEVPAGIGNPMTSAANVSAYFKTARNADGESVAVAVAVLESTGDPANPSGVLVTPRAMVQTADNQLIDPSQALSGSVSTVVRVPEWDSSIQQACYFSAYAEMTNCLLVDYDVSTLEARRDQGYLRTKLQARGPDVCRAANIKDMWIWRKRCFNCKEASAQVPCGTCAHAFYCCEACRKSDWERQHSADCQKT